MYNKAIANTVEEWANPNYEKKADSKDATIKKAKRMKMRFKVFEAALVFNIGFLIASVAFTILFRGERDILLFTIYVLGIICVNIYGYLYTKKELSRLMQNIDNRS